MTKKITLGIVVLLPIVSAVILGLLFYKLLPAVFVFGAFLPFLSFIDYLKRWIEINPEGIISTPFYYLVHEGTLMNSDELRVHYEKCINLFFEATRYYKILQKEIFGLINSSDHLPLLTFPT